MVHDETGGIVWYLRGGVPMFGPDRTESHPMFEVRAYAVHDDKSPLVPFRLERREPGPHDVQIEILYAGICHSDLHQAHDDWGGSLYPMVPGHEIVGRVVKVGAKSRN